MKIYEEFKEFINSCLGLTEFYFGIALGGIGVCILAIVFEKW